jgi:hypothetical protein
MGVIMLRTSGIGHRRKKSAAADGEDGAPGPYPLVSEKGKTKDKRGFRLNSLVASGVLLDGLFLRKQFGKSLLGANVVRFHAIQFFFRLDAEGDCHETVEAAGVETAVFILGAAIHRLGALRIFNDVRLVLFLVA